MTTTKKASSKKLVLWALSKTTSNNRMSAREIERMLDGSVQVNTIIKNICLLRKANYKIETSTFITSTGKKIAKYWFND